MRLAEQYVLVTLQHTHSGQLVFTWKLHGMIGMIVTFFLVVFCMLLQKPKGINVFIKATKTLIYMKNIFD